MRPVVFFDLDDTLFDHTWSMRESIRALRGAFAGLGATPADEVEGIYVDALEELHLQVLAGTLTIEEARRARLERMLRTAGDDASPGEVARAVELQRDSYQAARRAVPGSAPLLARLREHVRIGIITNNLRDEQVDKLAVCGLTDLVDDMVTSGELGISKPAPEIFEVALRRIGTSAARSVMVGDSWRSDVTGARGVGIRAVWFNRHEPARLDEPEVDALTSWEPLDDVVALLVRLAERP